MPPTGYYKKLLPPNMHHIIFAYTHSPISGPIIIDPSYTLEVLAQSDDPWAAWYIHKIKEGAIAVCIMPRDLGMNLKIWAPAELL